MSAAFLILALAVAPGGPDALGQNLFCLCGCAQTLATCPQPNCSELAPERGVYGRKYLEADLSALASEGLSADEILDRMARKYGERVLTIPRAKGLGVWAWIAPVAALLAGLGAVVWFLVRERASPDPTAPDPTVPDP